MHLNLMEQLNEVWTMDGLGGDGLWRDGNFFLRLGWRGCCLGLWVFYVVVQVGGLWILFWV